MNDEPEREQIINCSFGGHTPWENPTKETLHLLWICGRFEGIHFANTTFIGQSMKRVELYSYTFDKCRFQDCDFTGSDHNAGSFSECEFEGVNFRASRFNVVSFRDSTLKDCSLRGCIFTKVDFDVKALENVDVSKVVYNNATIWPDWVEKPDPKIYNMNVLFDMIEAGVELPPEFTTGRQRLRKHRDEEPGDPK